ncbi:MAG: hypothetical protein PHI98_02385 [Eubacteriales bacterium]|nr:hypothetical protein [Eubacteriales bacterium]
MKKRVFSLMLVFTLLLSCAAGAETTKHERVFAVVSADGAAQTIIDSVRLDNADALDEIIDKTALSDIENVGGHEAFTQDGENLVWQAAGKSITYQGNGNEALFVSPILTVTADGKAATDLTKLNGSVTVTVSYQVNRAAPYLAVSALLLDPETFVNVSADNAVVMEEGSRTFLVGYAVPGADSTIGLPDHFSFTCNCTDATLNDMYTVVTAQPVKALAEEMTAKTADGITLADTLTECLTALRDGKDLPVGDEKVTDVFAAVATLRDGASQLAEGSSALADGAASLCEGATQLQQGLATLTENNDALNQGAAQVFAATLTTVNAQLATAGLDAAGITLPELTAENYALALQGVMDQLNPEALKEQATAAASEKVRAAVEKQKEQVVAGVTQAMQAKVLEGVLAAAGMPMTAEDYEAAIKADKVPSTQAQQIEDAVKTQMATDEVKAQLNAAVEQQIEALVAQNVAAEDVQKQINDAIAPAQTAYDSIAALKAQLDSLNTFVTGIASYTAGVTSASEGATQLTDGSVQLAEGSKQLAEGSAQLNQGVADGIKKIVDTLLPTLTDDVLPALTTWSATADSASALTGYDLAVDGMTQNLVFIIRTDATK